MRTVTVEMPESLVEQIDDMADEENETRNKMTIKMIDRWLDER